MSQELIDAINQNPPGWLRALELVITSASVDEVTAEWTVTEKHHQGYGIVHGGVHSSVIETLASLGAALYAMPRKQRVVGLENHTSFIRAVRDGKLRAVARPVTRGRSSQVWDAWIRDADNRLVAQGSVRLLCIPEDQQFG
jgi:1,4-dihydroxy-2-naphthoyl-CoA hydrolase